MRAIVDPTLCTGCRLCEVVCPEVFQMDKSNGRLVATVVGATVPPDAECFCRDARDICPPRAITVRYPLPP